MGVRDDIAEELTAFCKAIDNQDGDAVGDFYTDGAWLLPGAPMIEGRAGIRGFAESLFAAGLRSLELERVAVVEGGDLAVEVGRFTMGFVPEGKEEGKYIAAWRRQRDGTLWIEADSFNADAPTA